MPRIAAVTMSYNEPDWAPIWARHYASELGAAHCTIIDHGTDDRSLDGIAGVNVLRIPRSPQDDGTRARAVSLFCASLLEWYDVVIHTDIDEILVADPARHPGLRSLFASDPRPAISAIGLDIVHVPSVERPLALTLPVTRQRRWVRFASAMCKPVAIRQPVTWAPGFHCIGERPAFGDLYLFHLRYADLGRGLVRLARSRAQPWRDEDAGAHQRMPDADWAAMVHSMAGLPRVRPDRLDREAPPLRSWLDRVEQSAAAREGERYRIDLHLSGDALWRLPTRFVDRF